MHSTVINQKPKLFFITAIVLMQYLTVRAQDLEPRAYTNIPVGLNFALSGYGFSEGGLLFDPSVPIENAHITVHSSLLAYARSLNIFGKSGKFDMILPYAWLSGDAEYNGDVVTRVVSGLGDPRMRFSVILVGAPALSLAEFKDYKQDFVVGMGLQVFFPLGQYDPEKLVNIGTNRFTFKPEIGISKTISKLVLELAGGANIYTVNNNFNNGQTRSQSPIGSVQGHINYNFRRGMWAALDGTYYWGGKSTTNGVEGNDLQKNTRVGLTFVLPLNIHHSLRFTASSGVSTRTGTDYNTIGIVWQYRWGGGIPK